MKNKVDMADVCELAHTLTILECEWKHIVCDLPDEDENGDSVYTDQAQVIFDKYYDLITNTLKV